MAENRVSQGTDRGKPGAREKTRVLNLPEQGRPAGPQKRQSLQQVKGNLVRSHDLFQRLAAKKNNIPFGISLSEVNTRYITTILEAIDARFGPLVVLLETGKGAVGVEVATPLAGEALTETRSTKR